MPRRFKLPKAALIRIIGEKVEAMREMLERHGVPWTEEAAEGGDVTFALARAEVSEEALAEVLNAIPREYFRYQAIIVGDLPPEQWPDLDAVSAKTLEQSRRSDS